MKRIIIASLACFLIITCYAQVIEGDFKVVSIDSIDHYYMIFVQDSLAKKKLILSLKVPEDTIKCKCERKNIEVDAWYHLTLQKQFYILANREENVSIDLLVMNYYDGDKFIAGRNKLPYCTCSFFKLSFCPNIIQDKE